MSEIINSQAMSAAFVFGIALTAAAGAAIVWTRNNGSAILRDGSRLVLAVFLISASLWAATAFVATLVNTNSNASCQIAVAIAAFFDQLARVSLEQHLAWSLVTPGSNTATTLILQGAVFLRFGVGVGFVAVQRPQFAPVCVTSTSLLALGIAVLATDGILIVTFLGRGLSKGLKTVGSGSLSVKISLAVWTLMSVPMILGIESLSLVLRTVLPAIGLLTVITALLIFQDRLVPDRTLISSSSSPEIAYNGSSSMTRDISTSAGQSEPPMRYEIRAGSMVPVGTGPTLGGTGGISGATNLYSTTRVEVTAARDTPRAPKKLPKGKGTKGKLVISGPMAIQGNESNLDKIPTVDLATAAKNEKERRVMVPQTPSAHMVATRPAPAPPLSAEQMAQRSQNIKRRELAPPNAQREQVQEQASLGTSSSAQLSPGVEEIRRRSPRHQPEFFTQKSPTEAPVPPKTPATPATPRTRPVPAELSSIPLRGPMTMPAVAPPPRSPRRPVPPFKMDAAQTQKPEVKENPTKESPAAPNRQPSKSGLPSRTPRMSQFPPPVTQSQVQSAGAGAVPPMPNNARKTLLNRNESVKRDIRPSKQGSVSSVEETPKSAAAPSEKRQTMGLPSNPRFNSLKRQMIEPRIPIQQEVMVVSHIEYNDPRMVQNVIDLATEQMNRMQTPVAPVTAPLPNEQVLHRPRPVPRKPSVDRAMFPTEIPVSLLKSQGLRLHQRSKSTGSVRSKKSILNSSAGSPTQLPPLPPLPLNLKTHRPQPNNTKSMTFDEKMELLYHISSASSTAPNTPKSSTRRRSISDPEVPRVPSMYQSSVSRTDSVSTATTKSKPSSVSTSRIFNMMEKPAPPALPPIKSIFNTSTPYKDGEEPKSWFSPAKSRRRSSFEGSRRQSSPVLPTMEFLRSPSVAGETVTNDWENATTNWGSLHSPVEPINMQRAKEIAIPPMPSLPVIPSSPQELPANEEVHAERNSKEASEKSSHKEVFTIMLDPSALPVEASPMMPTDAIDLESATGPKTWHRRVGDDCPSFSQRHSAIKARKMPPPTPLSFNRPSKVTMIVEAEPSPLESPQQALQMIQSQLEKLETATRASTELTQRMTLLAQLEQEMGDQEDHWLQMKHDLVRDSTSTLGSTQVRDMIREAMSDDPEEMGSQNKQSLRKSQLSSQVENRTRPTVGSAVRMSYLSVHTSAQAPWGSPTPPDSEDSASESEGEAALLSDDETVSAFPAALWCPAEVTREFASVNVNALWMPVARPAQESFEEVLSREGVRSMTKKSLEPLTITSAKLWNSSQAITKAKIPHTGLWKNADIPAAALPSTVDQQPSRPRTMKPPRRSRRMTLLADIPESPAPLPDKRGTLGIFKFPWGELSDTPVVQPRPQTINAIPGTMSSGRSTMVLSSTPAIPTDQFDPDSYSSSYFDDFEEEDEGDNFDDYDSDELIEDGQDEFDETTLWEIASLLKSDQVPSRGSLFFDEEQEPVMDPDVPPAMPDLPPCVKEGIEEARREAQTETKHDSTPSIDLESFPSPPSVLSKLWAEPTSQATLAVGLPQPDEKTWKSYVIPREVAPRGPTRLSKPASVESRSLWTPEAVSSTQVSLMWAPSEVEVSLPTEIRSLTWSKTAPAAAASFGLPQPEQVWKPYAVEKKTIRGPARSSKPASITSQSLWSVAKPVASPSAQLMWASTKAMPKPSTQGNALMWSQPTSVTSALIGLPQSEKFWKSYAVEKKTIRGPTRSSKPASIVSQSLWSVAKPTVSSSAQLMWSSTKAIPQSSTQGNALTWSQPVPVTIAQIGLPQPDTKTWTASVAGVKDTVRAKPRKATPAFIMTTEMWTPSQAPTPTLTTLLWSDAAKPAVAVREQAAVTPVKVLSKKLWAEPMVIEEQASGLFSLNFQRSTFRTTAEEPAALKMVRKVRTSKMSLPTLQSTSLWSAVSVAPPAVSWIEAGSRAQKLPEIVEEEMDPIEAISENKRWYRPSFEYPDDWENALEEAIKASYLSDLNVVWNVRLAAASSGQWDAALREAIKASRAPRQPASENDWARALAEAIQASNIEPGLTAESDSESDYSSDSPISPPQPSPFANATSSYKAVPEPSFLWSEPELEQEKKPTQQTQNRKTWLRGLEPRV
ncbi:hypothetical protein B0I35DRAFT_436732 [Stachybotrys elegans]|uniref:Uncharacterized protein n=1 Tax=Stachybotrys elegans TaxID=80388 RepID=A0A8K0SHD7_9HYPO|nr:hypothetical protein B0I35DRAFT_436732 [Stachybotrys elegans]